MKVYFLLFLFFIYAQGSFGQEHPLSKSDSGIILSNLNKYEFLIKNGDFRSASEALNNAAFVFWNNNHYKNAAKYYEMSLNLNEKVANENGIAMINNNLGMLYSDLGQYEKAISKFSSTLGARRASNEPVGVISALINLSVVLNNLQRYDESLVFLLEALDIARELYDKHQMRSVYGMLSETYEKKGNVEKSLQYFELYKTFHEEIQRSEVNELSKELKNERINSQLAEAERAKKENEVLRQQVELLEKQVHIEEIDSINKNLYSSLTRKEVELKLLEKDKEFANLEAKSRTLENEKLQTESAFLKFGLLFFIVAGAIIIILISNNIRKSKRHNQELALKNEAIVKQKVELELANQTKDRIFSILSHDLRSPMASLEGFLMMIDEFDVSSELRGAFSGIESQLANNSALLENLLLWSRTQLDNSPPSRGPVSVKSVVDDTFRLLDDPANRKNIKLISNITEGNILNSDSDSVNIVVRNVVQNAIKFTHEGGEVAISFEEDEDFQDVMITDNGIGMDTDKIQSLFDIATNRTSRGTKKERGSGLGMILSAELMARIGAKILVKSEVGKGSMFTLRFPKAGI